ncbi:MAG: HAD-IC family P-type ATPase, partial [Myxococcaceae bacterium]
MRRALPLQRLPPGVDPLRGLSGEEIPARAERYGPNAIVERVRRPWRDLVRDTARDPMIWFLVGTSAVYFALGAARDAAGLLIAIVPLIGMDAWLHRRTQASLAALAGQLSRKARVVRDGALAEVDARDLVVGDLAVIGAGEPFPADGIVLSGAELQSDESALTGESWPVRKRPLDPSTLSGTAPMVEGDHWVYAGTRLLTGEARIRVVFTGEETTYGEIVRLAQKGSGGRTPLQSAVGGLVSLLVVAAGLLCVALALVRWTQGHGVVDALVSAATLAVAALPEEFPVALTFFLGAGAYRLARRRALVRRAVTVENIGRVSVICSDKTGTLTEGRLALADLVPHAVEERELLRVAALASRPEAKDPLDTVLTESARRQGIPLSHDAVAIFPFTEDRRRETAVLSAGAGRLECVTKGAPEVILSLCTLDPAERAIWSERVSELAARGRKVVAVARQPLEPGAWRCGEPLSGYELLGLVGCADPIREGVPEAIAACRAGGIHVLMVTGDHPVTARAVARELGLGGRTPRIATGEELDGLLQSGDGFALRKLDVIARALPAQKLALVRALQRAGELVAVTG